MYKIETNVIGKIYGRLKVIKRIANRGKEPCYLCACSCGNKKEISGASMRRGFTKSCGCLAKEVTVKMRTTHGLSKHPLYPVYQTAKARCHNKSSASYHKYGAKGIKMCKAWRNSFKQFLDDMGSRPKGLTIERINNAKGYRKL